MEENRREIRCHVEQLLEMKPFKRRKGLRIGNVCKRSKAGINHQFAGEQQRGGFRRKNTLHYYSIDKLPEELMDQYYRWVKENQKVQSVIILKYWTITEAEYQMQATELKHGLKSGNPP